MASDRPFHVCQLADERVCAFNSDCPPGQVCGADGQCRDQCAATRDCLFEQTCVGGTCADNSEVSDAGLVGIPTSDGGTPASGVPCLYTSECPDPLVCRNKICSSECLQATDCSAGYDCVNNRCVTGSGSLIGPEGGEVTVSGGKVKLTILAGSLRSPVSILILPLEAWPAGALGQVYQILPSGLQFVPAATLTFTYDAADISATPPDQLNLATAVGSKWTPLPTAVDVTKKTVTAPLGHLSTYGIIGPANAADASTAGAGGSTGFGGATNGAGGAGSLADGAANGAGGALGASGSTTGGDGGLPSCQVICTSIDGCDCHTVGLCAGHNYSCTGSANCTCYTDTTPGASVLDVTCTMGLLSGTDRGCGFPFIELPPG